MTDIEKMIGLSAKPTGNLRGVNLWDGAPGIGGKLMVGGILEQEWEGPFGKAWIAIPVIDRNVSENNANTLKNR